MTHIGSRVLRWIIRRSRNGLDRVGSRVDRLDRWLLRRDWDLTDRITRRDDGIPF